MRRFDYRYLKNVSIPTSADFYLSKLYVTIGKLSHYDIQKSEGISELVEWSKIQSAAASARMAGLDVCAYQMEELRGGFGILASRKEKESLGYLYVLDKIEKGQDYRRIDAKTILQIHRDLYKYVPKEAQKGFKCGEGGFQETERAIEEICRAYQETEQEKGVIELLSDLAFLLDFLCIQPFEKGNDRVSRLLMLVLLSRHRYIVGKYVSIESILEITKEDYDAALKQSCAHWQEGKGDIWPFVTYMLLVILIAYKGFEQWLSDVNCKTGAVVAF